MRIDIEQFKIQRKNDVLGTAINTNTGIPTTRSLATKETKSDSTMSPLEIKVLTDFRLGKSIKEIAKETYAPSIRIEQDDKQYDRWIQKIYRIVETHR